ncbi:S-layer homology domain-containing protein [Alteribacillus iranensis]|uniref:S-layer homology domain-containing protein n=1 Tax=Alteribacillus iranensis TaxID=930128 RepID=A0A1I2BTB4_9BACI|nr:S-layer homology domain-containing protein [Alteribacillus iranensis]SFE59285.1 S-layer homology domain-containing protein [Alteribacillus iranensis]
MAYQPKSYRKFLAGSVSAAMVATTFGAVAPVNTQTTEAAESFSDVPDEYWASGSIQRLADEGIIHGYSDGTYRPSNTIVRGQVAAMLVAAFDLPTDDNAEPPFEDLNPESYFTPYAAAVKEAGLIRGREDNTIFAAGMDLPRQQMATILVRAFDLEPIEGAEADVTDLDEAHESHRENIKILAQHNITNTADGQFRPSETVTRAQFAVFLDRAMELKEEEDDQTANLQTATAVDNTTVEVAFSRAIDEVNAEHFTFDPELDVEDAEIIAPEDSSANQNAEGTVVRLTTEEQDADETYQLTYGDESVEVTAPESAFTVAGIDPVNTTSFDIELEEELADDLDEEDVAELLDITLRSDDDETDIDATDITINEDRDTITVEHADNDLEGTSGILDVNGYEYEFDYETIEVESVEATTETIRQAEDQELGFTVNGFRNVSVEALEEAGYDVEFLFNESGGVFDDAKDTGVIDASNLLRDEDDEDSVIEEFRYAVQITDEDGNEVTSDEQTVNVHGETEAAEVTDVAFFTGDDQWENDYVTNANEGAKIQAVAGTNAFGEDLDEDTLNGLTVESVTSSDLSVAYYDTEDGLQVVGEGTTTFTVTFDGVEEPVEFEVEVVEDQEIDAIAEADTTRNYTTNAVTDTFTVIDQYGEPYGEGEEISYTLTNENGEDVTPDDNTAEINSEGKVEVSFPSEVEPGEYTLEFSQGDNELGSVTLEFLELNADEVDEFTLSSTPETVDLADALSDGEIVYTHDDLEFSITAGGEYEGATLNQTDLEEALNSIDGDLQLRTSDESVASLAEDEEQDVATELEVSEVLDGLEAYGRSEGTATLYLEEVEGDFVTTLAQVEVEVESTIPEINDITLADDVDSLELSAYEDANGNKRWNIESLSDLVSDDVELESNMIEEVIYSENDEKALIRVTDVYGGQSFEVDAVVNEE